MACTAFLRSFSSAISVEIMILQETNLDNAKQSLAINAENLDLIKDYTTTTEVSSSFVLFVDKTANSLQLQIQQK